MLTGAIPGIINLLTKAIPDADLKNKIILAAQSQEFELAMKKLAAEAENALAQVNVNQAEAQTGSLFLAGWRPLIGWVCGISFALNLLIFPITVYLFALFGHTFVGPTFDMETLMVVMTGILGLGMGGLRTYEKLKAIQTEKVERQKKMPKVELDPPFQD